MGERAGEGLARLLEGLEPGDAARGFYHDGHYPTLPSVVDHYDSCLDLGLSARE